MLPHLMRPKHFQMAKQQSQIVKCTREPVSGGLMQVQHSRLMQVQQNRLHYFDIAVLSSEEIGLLHLHNLSNDRGRIPLENLSNTQAGRVLIGQIRRPHTMTHTGQMFPCFRSNSHQHPAALEQSTPLPINANICPSNRSMTTGEK
jgi:hypothetical protein